jgi:two-component system NtrC family sensor kinase
MPETRTRRALIVACDTRHAEDLRQLLEQHHVADEVLIQTDPTNDIGAHESLHRLASLGTLAAGAAHEIGNLLTYVSVTLERLSRAPSDDSSPETWPNTNQLETASECCRKMQHILRGITGFARRPGEGRSPVQLREVVDQAVRLVETEMSPSVELVVEHGAELPIVMGNGDQVCQVLVNLLLNAAQALPRDNTAGRIEIRTWHDDGAACVSVRDNGTGIAADDLHRVFEAFFTTKADGVGTGLGLYLARSIVRAHGGDLTLASELGRGTTVTLTLPGR